MAEPAAKGDAGRDAPVEHEHRARGRPSRRILLASSEAISLVSPTDAGPVMTWWTSRYGQSKGSCCRRIRQLIEGLTDGAFVNATIAYSPDGTISGDSAFRLFRDTFPYLQTPLSGSAGPTHP